MEVNLLRATIDDAKELHIMQVEARLKQGFTYYYFICVGSKKVGAKKLSLI